MKKVLLVLVLSAVITACGGNKSANNNGDSTAGANQTAKQGESSADTNANKIGTEKDVSTLTPGAKLMASSDCNTCHKENDKVIGPALKDIAAKYPATDANVDTLVNKVIHGGSGHWGTVPMAAHPTLAAADVKVMVKYILSLKK